MQQTRPESARVGVPDWNDPAPTDPVGTIRHRTTPVVRDDFALDTVESLIADWNIPAVPVTDATGRFHGFLSANDVVRARSDQRDSGVRIRQAGPATVADVATARGASIASDAPLEDAVARMIERDVERLAVLDASGSVVGVVTALDVLRTLAARPAGAVSEPPPDTAPVAPMGFAGEQLDVLGAFAIEPSLTGASLRALEAIRAAHPAEAAMLWVLDGAREVLRCIAVSSNDATAGTARFAPLLALAKGDGIAGRAWATDSVVGIDATELAPPDAESTELAIPLRAGKRVVGVLELRGVETRQLGPAAVRALATIAGELGRLLDARRASLLPGADASRGRELGAPSVAFFDPHGRVTFECGPSMLPASVRDGRAPILGLGGADHPVARGVRRAAAGHAFTELADVPGAGPRCLSFAPVRVRSGAIAGVVAVGIEGPGAHGVAVPGGPKLRLHELGAGAAHELNDVLTALRLSFGSLLEGPAQGAPLSPTLPDVARAVHRVERVAEALGAVAEAEGVAKMHDLRVVLDGVLSLLTHRLEPTIEISRRYDDVPLVRARPAVLFGALVDAFVALFDAAPPGRAHELRVTTRADERDLVVTTLELRLRTAAARGQGASSPSTLGTVVDSARDLVRELGGELVASAAADHLAIHLALPLHEPSRVSAPPPRSATGGRARKRVLVVDDDTAVADAIARELSDEHDVSVAYGGRRALQLLFRPHAFDVVVCDLMMPEVTGMDVYELVLLHDPTCARRFVFITGAAFTDRASTFLEQVPNPRLLKPFSGEALRAMVEERAQVVGPAAASAHST